MKHSNRVASAFEYKKLHDSVIVTQGDRRVMTIIKHSISNKIRLTCNQSLHRDDLIKAINTGSAILGVN